MRAHTLIRRRPSLAVAMISVLGIAGAMLAMAQTTPAPAPGAAAPTTRSLSGAVGETQKGWPPTTAIGSTGVGRQAASASTTGAMTIAH